MCERGKTKGWIKLWLDLEKGAVFIGNTLIKTKQGFLPNSNFDFTRFGERGNI